MCTPTPCSTINHEIGYSFSRGRSLTAALRGGLEDFGNLSVHLNHEALPLLHLEVPNLDLLTDPIREYVLHHGVTDVRNPLLRRLVDLLPVK